MGLKEVLLKKGWAGRTLSRAETVERLNPLIKQHMALNHCHNYVITHCADKDLAAPLNSLQRTARVDVGKLMETVLSCGGVAYNGTELEPDDIHLGTSDDAMLFAVLDEEQAFRDALNEEMQLEHQMRTRAVLTLLHTNSQERFTYLKNNTRRRRRPAS